VYVRKPLKKLYDIICISLVLVSRCAEKLRDFHSGY